MPKTGSRAPLAHDRRTFMKAGGVVTTALFAEGALARPARAQALSFRFFDRA